jgi:hypothetical protein
MAKDKTGMSPKAARKLAERTKRRLGLVDVAPIAASVELTGEVYTIQALADGVRLLVQRYYESHDNMPDAAGLLAAIRILDVADERFDRLGERVEGLDSREVANG